MMRWLTACLALVAMLLFAACDSPRPPTEKPVRTAPTAQRSRQALPTAPAAPTARIKWRYPAAERVVAFGDVHGDLAATRAALKLASLIDDSDRWAGGKTVAVQAGDVLDRGDDEQAILDWLLTLQQEAKRAGGALHVLHGNHELMNVAGDLRYVTAGGFRDFEDVPGLALDNPRLTQLPAERRARVAAFLPGGVYAKKIAHFPVVLVVGDSVFSHGDVMPKYAREAERTNNEVAAWLLGGPAVGTRVIQDSDSPAWSRRFSQDPSEGACKLLEQSLSVLKVVRMVVAHTPQRTIEPACDGKLWRVDVGMSAHYGGKPEVLEISGPTVRVIR